MAATWTNAGLGLVASALQGAGVDAHVAYVGISTGCGVLGAPYSGVGQFSGVFLRDALPITLAGGQSLTITDGTQTDVVTVASTGAAAGVNLIPCVPFVLTGGHSYAAYSAVVVPTPAASDLVLYNEGVRIAANAGTAGAGAGESLTVGYFDSTQPTGMYGAVGYFGGPGATATPGTGTLMAADVQFWNHTLNADSNAFTLDTII